MAVSKPRFDPTSAADVANATFSTGRRGFDQADVREFLKAVSGEIARLQAREAALERELAAAEQRRQLDPSELDEATVTAMLGEETARVLATARDAAAQIRARAEDGAARLLREAQDDAARLRTEGEIEAARRRQDAGKDAEAEVEAARAEGRHMVNEAREYRERVLADIAKRREQAKGQLHELAGGRDRLVQAFERARLVTADVLAEFHTLGVELDDEISSGPPTEPVPIIVRNSPPPAHVAESPLRLVTPIDPSDDVDEKLAPHAEVVVLHPNPTALNEVHEVHEVDAEPESDDVTNSNVDDVDASSDLEPALEPADRADSVDVDVAVGHVEFTGADDPVDLDIDPSAADGATVELAATGADAQPSDGEPEVNDAEPTESDDDPHGESASMWLSESEIAEDLHGTIADAADGLAEPPGEIDNESADGVQPGSNVNGANAFGGADEAEHGGASPDDSDIDHREQDGLATVVGLFSRGAIPDEQPAATKPSVDDLFARLKASGPAAVAGAVITDQRQAASTPEGVADDAPSPASDAASPPANSELESDPDTDAGIAGTTTSFGHDIAPAASSETTHVSSESAEAESDTFDDLGSTIDDVDDAPESADPIGERDLVLTPLDISVARRMKRVLADEQNDVLDILRRKEPIRAMEQLMASPHDHLASYRDAVTDDITAAAEAGASTQSADPTWVVRRLDNDGVVPDVLALLETELVNPLRQRLERTLRDADGDNAEIANHVRAIYREVKSQRLDDLATEMNLVAYGRGRFAAIAPGTMLTWLADPSCPDLRSNGAAGPVAAGSAFPSGDRFPPTHAACGCLVVPAR